MPATINFVVESDSFDEMAAKLGLSRLALVNHSLSLMKWAIEQKEEGRKIYSSGTDIADVVPHEFTMKCLEFIHPTMSPTKILPVVQEEHQLA